jgi:hypothetical protein
MVEALQLLLCLPIQLAQQSEPLHVAKMLATQLDEALLS